MGFDEERQAMVRTQLLDRGILDWRVLDAMARVPRHLFVSDQWRSKAYADRALPIERGQTISQPFVVALMVQALALTGSERVLEIGTGSGYAAAVLGLLAAEVYTIERWATLAAQAEQRLQELGMANVHIYQGDGTAGLPDFAPYDAILVSAAAPWAPQPLRQQLADGGRLVIPVGGRNEQLLLRITQQGEHFHTERLSGVRFVPLIGEHAWDSSDGAHRAPDSDDAG